MFNVKIAKCLLVSSVMASFFPSLTIAASVASCTMDENYNVNHGTCSSYVCCSSSSMTAAWFSTIGGSAATFCQQALPNGTLSNDCNANTLENPNNQTILQLTQSAATAGAYGQSGVQCRYTAKCNGDGD